MAIKCDVCKEEEVLAMFEQVKRELGGADVVICNAGLAHNEPLLSGNTSQWREMMEVDCSCFTFSELCEFSCPGKCDWFVCVYTRVCQTGQGEGDG